MGGIMKPSFEFEVGLHNEYQAVITNEKDEVVFDSGWHKNVILSQLIPTICKDDAGVSPTIPNGSWNESVNIGKYIGIGTGNSVPVATQTQLDNEIKRIVNNNGYIKRTPWIIKADKNLMYCHETVSYQFNDSIKGQNITELGLYSEEKYGQQSILCTRALIKDSIGNPTTITLRAGEKLTINYKLYVVVPIEYKKTNITYNYVEGDLVKETKSIEVEYGFLNDYYPDYFLWHNFTTNAQWWICGDDAEFNKTNHTLTSNNVQLSNYYWINHKNTLPTQNGFRIGIGFDERGVVTGDKVKAFLFRNSLCVGFMFKEPITKTKRQRILFTFDFKYGIWSGDTSELT